MPVLLNLSKMSDPLSLTEATRKLILERYVSRYEDHVTPGMVAAVPAHGNEHMASEIMAVGPIQLDDLGDLRLVEEEQQQQQQRQQQEQQEEQQVVAAEPLDGIVRADRLNPSNLTTQPILVPLTATPLVAISDVGSKSGSLQVAARVLLFFFAIFNTCSDVRTTHH